MHDFTTAAMNVKDAIQQFRTTYDFLTDDCVADLESACRYLLRKKNDRLVREGQYTDKTYYIAKGAARTYYLKDGKDVTDWIALETDFISSINSFFLDTPSELYIEVLEETHLLELNKSTFLRLSDKYPDFDKLGKLILTQTLLQLQQRIVSLQFETAEQKLKNLLLLRPSILQRVPLTHIASYLGITLETLSRIKNRRLT